MNKRLIILGSLLGAFVVCAIGMTLSDSSGKVIINGSLTCSPVALSYTSATNIATDASLGNHFRLDATNTLFLANPTNPTDGQRIVWEIIQDGTGSHTMTTDSQFTYGTDITGLTLTTIPSKRDFITAIYNSTTTSWYVVGFIKGY